MSGDTEKIVLISDDEIAGDPSPQSDPIQAAPTMSMNAPGTAPGASGKASKAKGAKKAPKGSTAASGASAKASGSPSAPNVSGKSQAKKGKPRQKAATKGALNTPEGRLARIREYAAYRVTGMTQVQSAAHMGITAQTACEYEKDERWAEIHNEALTAFLRSTVFDNIGPIFVKAMQTTLGLMDDKNPSNRASALKSALDQMLPLAEKLGAAFAPKTEKTEQNQGRTLSVDGLTNDEVSVLLKAMLGQGQASQQAPGRGIVSGPGASTPTTSGASTGPAGARN